MLASTAAALILASPAIAHDGALGDGGPFRIEMTTIDPAGVESRWGNGEVEFHVESGTELIVIGLEKEPMVKVDAEGSMFVNESSPSWWVNQPGGKIPPNASSTAEPNWVWKMGGGSLQFHDHRIHYMGASLDSSTADGTTIFEFGLPVQVNGIETELRGIMVFDSTIDSRPPEILKESIPMGSSSAPEMESSTNTIGASSAPEMDKGSSTNTILIAVGVAALVAAAAAVVMKKR
jgi:hypothetical protein